MKKPHLISHHKKWMIGKQNNSQFLILFKKKKAKTTTLLLFRLSFIYINKIFFLCSVLLKPIVLACPGLLSSLRMKIPVKNSLTYTRRMYIANFFVPKNYRNSMTDEVCEKKV